MRQRELWSGECESEGEGEGEGSTDGELGRASEQGTCASRRARAARESVTHRVGDEGVQVRAYRGQIIRQQIYSRRARSWPGVHSAPRNPLPCSGLAKAPVAVDCLEVLMTPALTRKGATMA